MIKKTFFLTLFSLTCLLLVTKHTQAEARSHCRSNTRVQVNLGTPYSDAHVLHCYTHPVVVTRTIQIPQVARRTYYTPTYAHQVPAAYVEEYYVAPRPISFGGLSFSWNFFK